MEIVINNCYGGFGLSKEALDEYCKRTNRDDVYESQIPRDDEVLIQLVREMGKAVNSRVSELKIVDIPDGINWQIEEYDGMEWVAETHRTWG